MLWLQGFVGNLDHMLFVGSCEEQLKGRRVKCVQNETCNVYSVESENRNLCCFPRFLSHPIRINYQALSLRCIPQILDEVAQKQPLH